MRPDAADQFLKFSSVYFCEGRAEYFSGIPRMPPDDGKIRVASEDATMRLDAARNMDRLAIAIREIDLITR
jgi:hypothetical protein